MTFTLIAFVSVSVKAQIKNDHTETDTSSLKITYSCLNKSLEKVINDLQNTYTLKFQYNPIDIEDQYISIDVDNESVDYGLSKILSKTDLNYKLNKDHIILFKPSRSDKIGNTNSSKNQTISGYVIDAESTESLIGATIYDIQTGAGTVTNEYGFFSMTLPSGPHTMQASYIGYISKDKKITLDQDQKINFQLSTGTLIDEVVITSESASEPIFQRSQMSQFTIPVAQLKSVPVILGEEDIMKSLQLLPGVKSGSEGTSGIFVRGGSQDQNLILLDGVPVYNPAHALGIFSVFNADAIKSVSLTKGGHPARYGGRLSSIIDVRMKEGNLEEWHGNASLGLISTRASLSGPIIKDKLSILVSARRTYADIVLKPFFEQEENQHTDPALFFHDFNGKIQWKINNKHRIYLSGYLGKDKFGATFRDAFSIQTALIDWGNKISALRWNYEISNKLFANTTLTFSDYKIRTENSQETFSDSIRTSTDYSSGIQDLGAKIDFDYIPTTNHYIKFGVGVVRHEYNPGITQNVSGPVGDNNGNNRKIAAIEAIETDIYIEDDITLGKFKANIGVHGSSFAVENKLHTSVQPRLGLRYLISDAISIKSSFSKMTQYINLLTSEALSLPSDVWVPSTNRILPQQSWQAVLGIGGKLSPSLWNLQWDIEAYYKKMDNVLSYQEGASFLDRNPQDWEDQITQGNGESYGMEVFLQKNTGKLTGWIGYTLSWSNRQFDNINDGEEFPFRYDRRHDFSTVVSYSLTDNIKLSANWIYHTGNAVTLPKFQYPSFFPGSNNIRLIENGGDKNSFRMSPSHRLDWSISFTKKKKRYERMWVIGFYNTYYRKNPFYLNIESETDFDPVTGDLISITNKVKEQSLIPIIPSVSYQIKF